MYFAAIGTLDPQELSCLQSASRRAGHALVVSEDARQLMREQVAERGLPLCMFIPRTHDPRQTVDAIREVGELFAVPIIAMVEHPSELAFCEALAAGATDALVGSDVHGAVRRLVGLGQCARSSRPPKQNGLAVIATSDVPRRRQIGRTLRQAGFDIAFAAGPEELQSVSRGPVQPKLVVTTPSFAPNALGASAVQTVVLSDGRGAAPGSAESDATGALLFRAEEALRGGVQERRASRRIHFATVCSFRKAGDLQPSYGLTHNLSAGGLYLRTLDVPAVGAALWIELRLPYTNQTVHLRGEVVAVTLPGSGSARPAGCGIKLLVEQSPASDLGAFLSAYAELANRNPELQN